MNIYVKLKGVEDEVNTSHMNFEDAVLEENEWVVEVIQYARKERRKQRHIIPKSEIRYIRVSGNGGEE